MEIEEILNSQFEGKTLKDNLSVSVINRSDLNDIEYTRAELVNSVETIDKSTLMYRKSDTITIADILRNKELFASFQIKTIDDYFRLNTRSTYPTVSSGFYFWQPPELTFTSHQIQYYNYLISLFQSEKLLSIIECIIQEEVNSSIYRILIYEDRIDILHVSHIINFNNEEFNDYIHQHFNFGDAFHMKFENVDICHLTIIDFISENKYFNYFLEKLILGHELSIEERFDYLIANCPIVADQLVIEQLTRKDSDTYLLFLRDDAKYHYYLHELIYRLIDKQLLGKFEKEIYYILAHIINERPSHDLENKPLDKEEKIAILQALENADDYLNAKQLLRESFFSFVGVDLKNIPDIQPTFDWRTFLDIGEFLVKYKK